MYNHTPADGYIIQIAGSIRPQDYPELSSSHRIVRALQAVDSRIATNRFRSTVLDAIFEHAIVQHLNDDEQYAKTVIAKLERRWGKKRARNFFINYCDILQTWR